MIISEVIKELNLIKDEHGDINVRVEADHGQTPMAANHVGVGYIEEEEYMAESVHPDDVTEEHIKFVIIHD